MAIQEQEAKEMLEKLHLASSHSHQKISVNTLQDLRSHQPALSSFKQNLQDRKQDHLLHLLESVEHYRTEENMHRRTMMAKEIYDKYVDPLRIEPQFVFEKLIWKSIKQQLNEAPVSLFDEVYKDVEIRTTSEFFRWRCPDRLRELCGRKDGWIRSEGEKSMGTQKGGEG